MRINFTKPRMWNDFVRFSCKQIHDEIHRDASRDAIRKSLMPLKLLDELQNSLWY